MGEPKNKVEIGPKAPRRGQFTKGDPRIQLGRGLAGRKKKTVSWREAEDALREAIPRLMLMDKKDLKLLLEANPTGAEMLAAKYIHEHVPATVDRFLGKTATPLTGVDGKPLIPENAGPVLPALDMSRWTEAQVDRYIAATAQAHGAAATATPSGAPLPVDPALNPPQTDP